MTEAFALGLLACLGASTIGSLVGVFVGGAIVWALHQMGRPYR